MTGEEMATFFDRRRHARFVTAFAADMQEGDETRSVIIGDVSAGGCLLEHPAGFAKGARVHLRAKGLDMPARITWVRGDLCGICFAHVVDPQQVIRDNVVSAPSLRDLLASVPRALDAVEVRD